MMNKLSSIRSKASKHIVTLFVVMSIAAMTCLTCFATGDESSTPDLSATLQTSFTTMKNDVLGYIAVILPIALVVVGAFFGIKKAISFFKSTAK